MTDPRALLQERLAPRRRGWLDVRSELRHFALITYALPPERVRPHVDPRFAIATFPIDGRPQALVSAVPFVDVDFHYGALPFLKWSFGQTNYRAYVTDRTTGESGVWFFGTTLGSRVVHCARALWRIPWHHAEYAVDCDFDAAQARYEHYRMRTRSHWGPATIELSDTGAPMAQLPGFADLAEQVLLLTHPVTGWFHRLDGQVGTYSVSHPVIPLTIGSAAQVHFGLFARLGLLSPEEQRSPHSVLLCRSITFDVHLPPRRLRSVP